MDNVNGETTNEEMMEEERRAQVYDGTDDTILPGYLRELIDDLLNAGTDHAQKVAELHESWKGKTIGEIVDVYSPRVAAAHHRYYDCLGDPVYDGQDDSILPDRLRTMLEILPGRSAERFRDWLTGYSIIRLDADQDYILGHDHGIRPPHPDPGPPWLRPQPEEEKEIVVPLEPVDPWQVAREEVNHIAAMFAELKEVDMPDELAMRIIDQHVPPVAVYQTHAEMIANPSLRLIRTAGVTIEPVVGARRPPVNLDGLGSHFGSTIMGGSGNGG